MKKQNKFSPEVLGITPSIVIGRYGTDPASMVHLNPDNGLAVPNAIEEPLRRAA